MKESKQKENSPELADMKAAIYDCVERLGDTSFADLQQHVPKFRGEWMKCADPQYGRVVFWPWLSETARDALEQLYAEGLIAPHPSSPMIYAFDGIIPDINLMKNRRESKKDRWPPTTLRIVKKGGAS